MKYDIFTFKFDINMFKFFIILTKIMIFYSSPVTSCKSSTTTCPIGYWRVPSGDKCLEWRVGRKMCHGDDCIDVKYVCDGVPDLIRNGKDEGEELCTEEFCKTLPTIEHNADTGLLTSGKIKCPNEPRCMLQNRGPKFPGTDIFVGPNCIEVRIAK